MSCSFQVYNDFRFNFFFNYAVLYKGLPEFQKSFYCIYIMIKKSPKYTTEKDKIEIICILKVCIFLVNLDIRQSMSLKTKQKIWLLTVILDRR